MEIWKKMWVGVFFWTQCILLRFILLTLTLWRPLLSFGYNYKASCARPNRVKPSFVIFDIRALWRSALAQDMTTAGVKGSIDKLWDWVNEEVLYHYKANTSISCTVKVTSSASSSSTYLVYFCPVRHLYCNSQDAVLNWVRIIWDFGRL